MDLPEASHAPVIDLAAIVCRRQGIGEAMMRRQRISDRRGYIACTRLRLAQELERTTGRREPHW